MTDDKDSKVKDKKGLVKSKSKEVIAYYLAEPYVPYGIFAFLGIFVQALFPIAPLPSFISLYGSLSLLAMAFFVFHWTSKHIKANEGNWDPMKIETDILIVFGPYHYSRNPMFIAVTLLYISVFVFLNNMWGIIFLYPLIKILAKRVIAPREQMLLEVYGEVYQDYHDKTPKWL